MKRKAKNDPFPPASTDDSLEDEADDFEESPIEKPTPAPLPLSKNPIVASVEAALRKRGLSATVLPGALPEKFDAVCGGELRVELGGHLLRALIDGDKTFAKTVAQAVKKIDATFRRDREKAIFEQAWKYVHSLPEPWPSSDIVKLGIEKHCNHGRPLEDHQWRRLRPRLFLPALKAGRPQTPSKKR